MKMPFVTHLYAMTCTHRNRRTHYMTNTVTSGCGLAAHLRALRESLNREVYDITKGGLAAYLI